MVYLYRLMCFILKCPSLVLEIMWKFNFNQPKFNFLEYIFKLYRIYLFLFSSSTFFQIKHLYKSNKKTIIPFTEDVTPPSLYWEGAPPSLTHGSIVLSWTTNEAVTSLCTVHSPIKETEVPCNNKWVGTELRHGEYSLTVTMVDGSGNKAQAVHHWNNSKQIFFFSYFIFLCRWIIHLPRYEINPCCININLWQTPRWNENRTIYLRWLNARSF